MRYQNDHDLEDKTGRLFAHLPHVARVKKDGQLIRLHARSYEQVLLHLGYLSALIDYRYALSEEELERQPLVIVYLEEFLDLKDYFKQRVEAAAREEREQARADYARLVFCLKKLARRGLKVRVQLLLCAHVDYRDDDLQEALINITSGMVFCVRVSAAQAAGFYQGDLLARNARENRVGQAVVEMPDCKDLILAPQYDLKARLSGLARVERWREQQERQRDPLPFPQPAAPLPATTGTDETCIPPLVPRPLPQPTSRRAVTIQDAFNAFQEGATGPRKLERALGIPYNQARNLFAEMQRRGMVQADDFPGEGVIE